MKWISKEQPIFNKKQQDMSALFQNSSQILPWRLKWNFSNQINQKLFLNRLTWHSVSAVYDWPQEGLRFSRKLWSLTWIISNSGMFTHLLALHPRTHKAINIQLAHCYNEFSVMFVERALRCALQIITWWTPWLSSHWTSGIQSITSRKQKRKGGFCLSTH